MYRRVQHKSRTQPLGWVCYFYSTLGRGRPSEALFFCKNRSDHRVPTVSREGRKLESFYPDTENQPIKAILKSVAFLFNNKFKQIFASADLQSVLYLFVCLVIGTDYKSAPAMGSQECRRAGARKILLNFR